ncbi:LuxR C-terminal-related transcriptional regulator [Luteibacter aegosomatis]|uniref:LuxR C-terminal-related transcriptional regulator n=1 Tax=Luteibacter aegosomatis TaxID=2911537 RepID=UPI0024B5973F|nr:LuxR C-terminal-related transcriptional regulator [Luteibacter aegosomatis]
MCLGRESLDGPPTRGLAEEVFATLPWPCIVCPRDGCPAVMANEAFRREFAADLRMDLPDWLAAHLVQGPSGEELRLDGARRYRVTRQTIDLPPNAYQAIFLAPIVEDEPTAEEPVASSFAMLRPDLSLTRRESQVLDGIMSGKLNKVIAGELNISPKTVELHRANLMAKLRVNNVVELARAVLDASAFARTEEPLPETG